MGIKAGDIIAFHGRDVVSGVIQLATGGLPGRSASHIGIVTMLHNEPLVYESTSFKRPACERQRRVASGVQAHKLHDMLEFITDQTIVHYPLRRELYEHEADRLAYYLDSKIGTPYDLAGAIRSGGMVFNVLQSLLRRENLGSIFCSEFVAAGLVDVGIFATRSVSRWSPNHLIRALRRQGTIDTGRKLK